MLVFKEFCELSGRQLNTFIPAKEVEKREIPEMKKNSVQLLAHAQPEPGKLLEHIASG